MDLTEHNVLPIQPRSLRRTQKELTPIRIRTGIRHAQNSLASVLQFKVLVGELGPVNRLAAGTVVIREVTALAHEAGNDAMEGGAGESESLLAGAERAEVFGGAGDDVCAEFHDDASRGFAADGDVEVYEVFRHFER
eukprot:CAMPEP_0201607804 /NCGR_PEP_ID=MMETSP0492-20130828/6788_2 /ASSEMBLY_ACC=CAM_ASM_000837 /TAXON_ID=420259 /ORGANISM="Thalassiosira gravida, Strain GMp14c1" /LENGTH=136 /DNA_ID=CAMNT_0048072467 /DNA_START=169 /DNA_END=579 /DNA_ORIENTATION=-